MPRLLAMLCILAVFIPSFFMQGAARALFVPLSLAVGFAMITSLPALQHVRAGPVRLAAAQAPRAAAAQPADARSSGSRRLRPGVCAARPLRAGSSCRPTCVAAALVRRSSLGRQLGTGDLPAGRRRPVPAPPAGPDRHAHRADRGARRARRWTSIERGGRRRTTSTISVGYVGVVPSSYPINTVYLWTGGPEEAVLRVALKPGASASRTSRRGSARSCRPTCGTWTAREVEAPRACRPTRPTQRSPRSALSFEPADIVNEVMSFGSPTPVEVAVTGPNLADNRAYAAKVHAASWRRSRRSATSSTASRSTTRPSRSSVDREQAGAERRDRRATSARSLVAGHLVEPLRRAELLARPDDRASATRCRSRSRRR